VTGRGEEYASAENSPLTEPADRAPGDRRRGSQHQEVGCDREADRYVRVEARHGIVGGFDEQREERLVQLLLDHGAEPGATVNFIDTPLQAAMHGGNPEVIHRLIQAGAPQDQVRSALSSACMIGKLEFVEAIINSTQVPQQRLNDLLRISCFK